MYSYVLAFLVLFFPSKYFILYHAIIISFLLVYIFLLKKKTVIDNSLLLKIVFLLMVWIAIDSILVSIFFLNDAFRNLSEFFRFIPLLLLLCSFNSEPIDKKTITKVLFFYVVVVCSVCLLQFKGVSFINVITQFYNDPRQVENSLEISRRALGLSTGPGSNAVILVIIYSYFLALFYSDKNSKNIIFYMVTLLLSAFGILLSQSQTGFVVLILITLYSLFFNLLFPSSSKARKKIILLSVIIIICVILIITKYWEDLRYLLSLFDYGLERSSYQKREEKVATVIELITTSSIVLFLVGYGKDYIPDSAALDNEFIFLLSVYGLAVFLCILLLYFSVIIKSYILKGKDSNLQVLHFVIVSGIILSWPSSFLLDPRILVLLSIFISIYLRNKEVAFESSSSSSSK